MSKFAARSLTIGQINALVKKLGGEATVLAILGGTLKFSLEAIVAGELFDEAAFFQTRPGLWVDSSLERYVDFQHRSTRGAAALQHRQLEYNTYEDHIFGQLGSEQHAKTLSITVDLGQIAELITAQEGGKSGILLNNCYANIFPVRGKDGALHVVSVDWNADNHSWNVRCDPFDADNLWVAYLQVFSN